MDFADRAALTIHDVKNRLTLVAQRAEAAGDAATLREMLEAAAALSGLLALYKAEQGRLSPYIDAHVPADLVEDVVAESTGLAACSVVADLAGAPGLAFYDEALIRLVLRDAVFNALRHARRKIVVGAGEQPGWTIFSVHDDGPGYPEGWLDPAAGAAPPAEGSGLGLALARRVAALHTHQGRVGEVRLSNDDGALFRLFLPV